MLKIFKTIKYYFIQHSLFAKRSWKNLLKVIFVLLLLVNGTVWTRHTAYAVAVSPKAVSVYGQAGSFTTASTGTTSNTLNSQISICFDSSGDFYIADYSNNRVLYYPSGTTTATRVYGQNGSFSSTSINNTLGVSGTVSATSLSSPIRNVSDTSGNLYTLDMVNNRVLKFQTSQSVTTQPASSTVPGATFSMVSSLIDVGSGGVFSDFTGSVSVIIKAGTGAGGAVLSGTIPVSAVAGVATFSDLSINLAGTGYILTSSSTGVGSANTTAFNIASLTLLGYWPLDDASGTTVADLSSNGDPGTITGTPSWTTGEVNGALSFNGSTNYVSMGTPTPLKMGSSSFTVMSWFKTTQPTMGRMVSTGVSSFSTGFDLSVNVTNACSAAGCVGAELGGGSKLTSVSIGTTATTFNNNSWHQVAMVIDQSAKTAQIYVDGVIQSLSKQTGTCGTLGTTTIDITGCGSANATSTDPFTLGAYHSGSTTNASFAGTLDEVRVYNSALNSSQIQNQYAIDSTPTLAGYWPFSEDSGTTTADLSGNGSTGTITGAGWTEGEINSGLSFNGSSNSVSMGTPTALKFGASSFTYMNWFKTSDTTPYNRMISNGEYSWTPGYFVTIGQPGCIGCVGGGVGATTKLNSLSYFTNAAFNDGKWHQQAMVIDQAAKRAYIYIDGVAQNVTVDTGTCGVVAGGPASISQGVTASMQLLPRTHSPWAATMELPNGLTAPSTKSVSTAVL